MAGRRIVHTSGLFLCVCIILLARSAVFGIILHSPAEPVEPARPSNAMVGRWNTFASCVPISPNHVISTKHQDHAGGPNTVQINGITYKVAEDLSIAGDLRISRITTINGQLANLSEHAHLYTDTSINGLPLIMGGFGKVKGTELITDPGGTLYGYMWAYNPGNQLHWGANIVHSNNNDNTYVKVDFDEIGTGGHVPYEAAVAMYDSGGGWFIMQDEEWKLAGVTYGADLPVGETRFRDFEEPAGLNPDLCYAWRIKQHATTIETTIAAPLAPASITATASTTTPGQVQLSWPAVTGADGYRVYYSQSLPGPDFTPLGIDITGTNQTTITNLSLAKTYYFTVTAYSGIAESNYSPQTETAIPLFENFDDNIRGSMWQLYEDDHYAASLCETDQKLQILATATDLQAAYNSNEWAIDPAEDFSLKIDFHHELTAFQKNTLFIRIGPDTKNYISLEATCDSSGAYWQYREVVAGTIACQDQIPRPATDGTLFISYDNATDQLYLSETGYGPALAWQTIPNVPQTQWEAQPISVSIGATSDAAVITAGQSYLDNFTINTAALTDWPPKTDINNDGFIDFADIATIYTQWLTEDQDLQADVNGDNKVDFTDFAAIANAW